MMKFRTITILFLMITAIGCMAQRRQLQEARLILKGDKDYDKAETMMIKLLNDSTHLEYRDNPRIYDMWLQSVEKQYSQLNEMMYKKQEVDTVQLFDLTHRLFMIGERLDSIDMRPDKKGRVSPEYRKDNASRLIGYRPNLFFGGTYHLRKGDYPRAYDFFERYIDCTRQPLFSDYDLMNNDARIGEAAYWASYTGYLMNDPVLTLRYAKIARKDSAKLENLLQITAEAWSKLKDDSSYVASLWDGFCHFPKSAYFFPRLLDSYNSKGNHEKVLAIVDEALKADSVSQLFLLAKSTILLNLGRYDQSLECSKKLIGLYPDMADAYFNAGSACLNIALQMDSRNHRKQIRKMYQKALPYMETYRKLAPGETKKWGDALYRIYFNLNMGKQFDEIDKILKKQKS